MNPFAQLPSEPDDVYAVRFKSLLLTCTDAQLSRELEKPSTSIIELRDLAMRQALARILHRSH